MTEVNKQSCISWYSIWLDGQESKIVTCPHLLMKISGFLITKILITVYCVYLHRVLHREYAINKNITYTGLIFLLGMLS